MGGDSTKFGRDALAASGWAVSAKGAVSATLGLVARKVLVARMILVAARALAFGLALFAGLGSTAWAEPAQVLGAATCGASTCHDAAEPWPNSSVAQVEYRLWSETGRHRLAYQTLKTPQAEAIARRAGLPAPVDAPLCLSCHTAETAGASTGPRFTREEGVSCEACHGPASEWIGAHAMGLFHYDQVLAAGLNATADPVTRSQTCLRCHGPGTGVSHDILAAGHPRLQFDVAAFSKLQPAHFRLDDDYRQRKRPKSEAALWTIGASTAIAARLQALADPERGWTGVFPELSLLNCYSCHVTIKDRRAPEDGGVGLGSAAARQLDLSGLAGVLAVAEILDPALADTVRLRLRALDRAVDGQGSLAEAAQGLAEALNAVSARTAQDDLRGPAAQAVLERLLAATRTGEGRLTGEATAFALRAFAREAIDSRVLDAPDAAAVLDEWDARTTPPERDERVRLRDALDRALTNRDATNRALTKGASL